MTTWWILGVTLIMNNERSHNEYYFVRKEYCIQHAHNTWSQYYSNGYASKAVLQTICNEKKDYRNFINIYCKQNGWCNF